MLQILHDSKCFFALWCRCEGHAHTWKNTEMYLRHNWLLTNVSKKRWRPPEMVWHWVTLTHSSLFLPSIFSFPVMNSKHIAMLWFLTVTIHKLFLKIVVVWWLDPPPPSSELNVCILMSKVLAASHLWFGSWRKLCRWGQFSEPVSSGVVEWLTVSVPRSPLDQVLFYHLAILISNKNVGLDAQEKGLQYTTAQCPVLTLSLARRHLTSVKQWHCVQLYLFLLALDSGFISPLHGYVPKMTIFIKW